MTRDYNRPPAQKYSQAEYENAIVRSALWAAAGDALGWMTELSRGVSGVKHRTGKKAVDRPLPWKRVIGGRSGVTVDFPAGSYSDDTQLRLCVSRSIRSSGSFDVEAFAKIEITAWQGYALGAGVGSKAAASNLSKRGVNWFSNFFASSRQQYTNAGGNGAAMRIQPHIWSAKSTRDEAVSQIIRDSIVTHGHPHGFCGAVFHAWCLWDTLADREIPDLQRAFEYVECMQSILSLIENDHELATFWLPAWENKSKTTLKDAVSEFQADAMRDLEKVQSVFDAQSNPSYHSVLQALDCLTPKYRGSGFKTAFAAQVLAILFSPDRIESALAESANELESDTDTIATMAGALLGCLARNQPSWPIQDREYLIDEAQRLSKVAFAEQTTSFTYPDVATWNPPTNQSDAVVEFEGALALAGIGTLKDSGPEYQTGQSIWQWFDLPFGQTILAKRRAEVTSSVDAKQMPREPRLSTSGKRQEMSKGGQNTFPFDTLPSRPGNGVQQRENDAPSIRFHSVDQATDEIIASGFDEILIGSMINQSIERTHSIEAAVSIASIVAKARLARKRRRP